MRKAFNGGTVATQLNGPINNSTTSVTVADGSTYPSGPTPFVISVGRNTPTEEKMLVASRTGNTLTITTRGYDGSVAQAHADQTTVEHVLDAITVDEANEIANVMTADGALITRSSGSPVEVALGTTGLPLVAGAFAPSYAQVNTAGIADNAITSAKILDGTIVNADINASAAIVDTKLATISTANKVSLAALDIDGATEIGAALVDADVFPVDDGAGGTNRKSLMSRVATYIFGKVSNHITITSTGTATLAANSVASSNIVDGTIVNGDINASAAIAYSKLALNNTIVTADIQNGQITNAKLNTTAGEPGGAWNTFTPNVTGGTVTGSKTGRYIQIGKTVHFAMEVQWDTGSNFSGLQIDLPVVAQAAVNEAQFNVSLADGLIVYSATALVATTHIVPRAFTDDGGTSGLYIDSAGLSNTIPFTWGAADTVRIAGTYEAA
jgi:hypothetical protein